MVLFFIAFFTVSGLVIVFDQWTKSLVRDNLTIGEMWVPWEWVTPYARIIHWQNTGAAFGFGAGSADCPGRRHHRSPFFAAQRHKMAAAGCIHVPDGNY